MMKRNKNQEPLETEVDFLSFANDPRSLSNGSAKLFNTAPNQFIKWHWQIQHQVRSKSEAEKIIQLSESEQAGFDQLGQLFNSGISPYYLGLIAKLEKENPRFQPLRLQVVPRIEEASDLVGINDPLEEVNHSPVREVVHCYPDRVAFCVAMLCPVYCRYCFRKRRDNETGLHYNRRIIEKGIDYIASTPSIKDVLITGGDPFIASDDAIDHLLSKLKAIPHIEVLRFGTRTPVAMPYRITKKLCRILAKYHPIWLNTHFNCVEEITPEAKLALKHLADAGIPVGNQSVLLKGVNDTSEQMLALCRELIKNRVRPYYLFYPHMISGTKHLRVSYEVGIKIIKEMRGKISGFGIPTYIMDTPSGKIPLGYDYKISEDGSDLLLEGLHGEIWREKDAKSV